MFDQAKLVAQLESDAEESFRAVLYDDATGKPLAKGDTIQGEPTLAIGWNVAQKPVTRPQARIICGWHVADVDQELNTLPWFAGLDEVRARALADMCFQLGFAKLMQFAHMLQAYRAGAWHGAADAALDSAWAKECPNRASRIAHMIRTGSDP